MICDCIECVKRDLEVVFLETLQHVEERVPFIRLIEPVFPYRIENLLNCLGESPKRNAIRRIENFVAAIGGDREDGAGLREIVCSRKASAGSRSAKPAELSTSIPPLSEIHLAKSGND